MSDDSNPGRKTLKLQPEHHLLLKKARLSLQADHRGGHLSLSEAVAKMAKKELKKSVLP